MTHRILTPLLTSFVLLSSLTPTQSQARYHSHPETSTAEVVAGAALTIGGAVAAGIGLYSLGNWLFTPSDNTVMDKAHRATSDARRNYNRIIAALEREYNVNLLQVSATKEADMQRTANDRILTEITPEVGQVSRFLSDIRATRQALRSQATELRKRGQKSNCTPMFDLANELNDMAVRLSIVYHYVKHHEGFFALYPVYQALRTDYDHEIRTCSTYTHEPYKLEHDLRLAVSSYGHDVHSSYPHLDYVDCLVRDKNTLDNLTNRTTYNYDLTQNSRSLSTYLDIIKRHVMADPEYNRCLNARERDRLEQQRLALERERRNLELQRLLTPPQIVVVEKPRPVYNPPVIVVEQRPQPPVVIIEEPRPHVVVIEQDPIPQTSVSFGVHYNGNSNSYDYDAEVGFEA